MFWKLPPWLVVAASAVAGVSRTWPERLPAATGSRQSAGHGDAPSLQFAGNATAYSA